MLMFHIPFYVQMRVDIGDIEKLLNKTIELDVVSICRRADNFIGFYSSFIHGAILW